MGKNGVHPLAHFTQLIKIPVRTGETNWTGFAEPMFVNHHCHFTTTIGLTTACLTLGHVKPLTHTSREDAK